MYGFKKSSRAGTEGEMSLVYEHPKNYFTPTGESLHRICRRMTTHAVNEECKNKIKSHTTQIDSNTTQIDSHTTQIDSNTTQIDSNTTQVKSHTTQVKSNTEQILFNTQKTQRLENTLEILIQKFEEVEKSRKALKSELEDLKLKFKNVQKKKRKRPDPAFDAGADANPQKSALRAYKQVNPHDLFSISPPSGKQPRKTQNQPRFLRGGSDPTLNRLLNPEGFSSGFHRVQNQPRSSRGGSDNHVNNFLAQEFSNPYFLTEVTHNENTVQTNL